MSRQQFLLSSFTLLHYESISNRANIFMIIVGTHIARFLLTLRGPAILQTSFNRNTVKLQERFASIRRSTGCVKVTITNDIHLHELILQNPPTGGDMGWVSNSFFTMFFAFPQYFQHMWFTRQILILAQTLCLSIDSQQQLISLGAFIDV